MSDENRTDTNQDRTAQQKFSSSVRSMRAEVKAGTMTVTEAKEQRQTLIDDGKLHPKG